MKMNCADIQERIAAYLVDDLTVQERFWIEMHLRDCAECRAEIDSLADIATALQAEFSTDTESKLDPERREALSFQFADANPDIDIVTRRRWRRARAIAANLSVAAALLLGAYLGFASGNQRVQQPIAPEVTLEIASSAITSEQGTSRTTNNSENHVVSRPVSGVPYPDFVMLSSYYVPEYGNGTQRNAEWAASYAGLPVPRPKSDFTLSFRSE